MAVLALTDDGRLTYCTCPPEKRGQGRCNHVAHQEKGQSVADFIASVDKRITIEGDKNENDNSDDTIKEYHIEDLNEEIFIHNIVKQNGIMTEDPNWQEVLESINNPFIIGKEDNYEEAELVEFNQDLIKRSLGNTLHLHAKYKFRGKIYDCDYGEVPAVNENGTITVEGVNWRVLPVIEQNKAGIISYSDNIVVRQKDRNNIAMVINKETKICKILGIAVAPEDVEEFLNMSDEERKNYNGNLTTGQRYALLNIDPIAFERVPDFTIDNLVKLPKDQCNDLSYRRVLGYKEIVRNELAAQSKRMGVTFRTNLKKRENYLALHPNASDEDLDIKYPLFYQVNITENIKKDLVSRSNVQIAENLNPIAALSQSKKVSLTGPGGYNKDKAPGMLRMPHKSHEGLVDSLDSSSGKNVGLTLTLSNGFINSRGFIEKNPKETICGSDFIPYLYHDDPSRSTMAVAHLKQSCPITGGEEPIIKTKAWDSIKGAKLGCNLNVAYIPEIGNFEDAVVISESAASKMKTIKTQSYEVKNSPLKVGDTVIRKQQIGNNFVKVGGTVKSVSENNVVIETVYDMGAGDKLSNRHGGKCIVSKVLPDSEMPKIKNDDGTESQVDVIMSPLSIIGRKNLGAIMELNDAYDQTHNVKSKDNVNEQRTVQYGNHLIKASAGTQFCMRLNHIAEEKLSSYADEVDSQMEPLGSRLGEQESILLSTSEDRLKILRYLRNQEARDSTNKLQNLMKAIGVDMSITQNDENN